MRTVVATEDVIEAGIRVITKGKKYMAFSRPDYPYEYVYDDFVLTRLTSEFGHVAEKEKA